MAYIDKGTINDWLQGHTGLITTALFRKFKSEDMMSKAKMCDKIVKINTEEDDNPETVFMKLRILKKL